MSIEKTKAGSWAVRWRDEAGRNKSKVIGRKRDAEAYDAELRRSQRMGDLIAPATASGTLDEFAAEWWMLYAGPNLATSTKFIYAVLWDKHVSPRLGGLALRDVNAEVCQRFAADLDAAGIGPASRRKTLALLGSVLQRAFEWARIPSNPMKLVRKPSARRKRAVRPLSPLVVERLRASVNQRDSTMISMLAYIGLRPG